jgi:hypothetical protein
MPKNESAGMSDEAVKAKTGKTWSEWFAVLDKAKAQRMEHKAMAAYQHEKEGVPGWWRQMIAVAYERETPETGRASAVAYRVRNLRMRSTASIRFSSEFA